MRRGQKISTLGLTICIAPAFLTSNLILAAEKQSPSHATTEEIIEQILVLRQQIESLLKALPPEMREEIESRWRERQQAELPIAETELPPTIPSSDPSVSEQPAPLEPSQPTAESPVPETAPEPAPSLEPRATCGTLGPLDTNEDGLISGGDRYWRYLRLWFDNGNGTLEEAEIESPFSLGIRQIDVGMGSFKDSDDAVGDIDVDDLVRLHLHSRGRSGTRTGVLIIEAGRLARGDELWLVDSSGTKLANYQPLTTELAFEFADGNRHPLSCP